MKVGGFVGGIIGLVVTTAVVAITWNFVQSKGWGRPKPGPVS